MDGYIKTLPQDLLALHLQIRSWRKIGDILGYTGAQARLIALGKRQPSEAALVNWHMFCTGERVMFDVAPICPDCGSVHTGRCHGIPDPVVIIRPQRSPRPEPPAWLSEAAAWLRQREGAGQPIPRSYTRQGKVCPPD